MPDDARGWCQVPYCRRPAGLIYYDKGICRQCWTEYADKDMGVLKALFGIPHVPAPATDAQPAAAT